MIPRIICSSCQGEIRPGDRSCGVCGAGIEWEATQQVTTGGGEKTERHCPSCGYLNPTVRVTCGSCGIPLGAAQSGKRSVRTQSPPAGARQGWMLILGFVVLLVVIIIAVNPFREEKIRNVPVPADQSDASMREIEALQKTVDTDPANVALTLRLANLLHDARLFTRAVAMYERYLERDPSNASARVDLGIVFFEMSLMDTTRRPDFLARARTEMETALTHAPKHQLALFNLGVVALHEGDIGRSNTWFRRCVEVDPSTPTAKRAQQLLDQHSSTNPS